MADLEAVGFPTGVSKMTLAELLGTLYPEYKWDKVYLLRGRFAQQKRLERAIARLFPVCSSLSLFGPPFPQKGAIVSNLLLCQGEEVIFNARKETHLINPSTGRSMELDIYMPKLQFALEFQVPLSLLPLSSM